MASVTLSPRSARLPECVRLPEWRVRVGPANPADRFAVLDSDTESRPARRAFPQQSGSRVAHVSTTPIEPSPDVPSALFGQVFLVPDESYALELVFKPRKGEAVTLMKIPDDMSPSHVAAVTAMARTAVACGWGDGWDAGWLDGATDSPE